MEVFDLNSRAHRSHMDQLLPPRDRAAAKWAFGRLLAVCGSEAMPGAAVLACGSALRSGVGLVCLASVSSVTAAVSARHPECTLRVLSGEDGQLSAAALPQIAQEAVRSSALLCGCGLGRGAPQSELIQRLLTSSAVPLILDADGLNALEGRPELLRQARVPVVLTPHLIEMHRLCGVPVEELRLRPVSVAAEFARNYGVTVVFKGSLTTVASPGGDVWQLSAPNSGMAKGGSGDVLAGLIAGLAAQGNNLFDAARLGVYLHALAGKAARQTLGEYAMQPSDVIDHLGQAFGMLKR